MAFLTGQQAEPFLRKVEREVLDSFHESMPLWTRASDVATFGLLAAYDSLFLPLMHLTPELSNPGGILRAKYIQEGLVQALRWLLERDGQLAARSVDDKTVISDAGYFLDHATAYAVVADHHRSLGYGFVSAAVDETNRIVRFDGSGNTEAWMNAAGQVEAFHKTMTARPIRRLESLSRLGAQIRRLIKSLDHGTESSCIQIHDPNALNHEDFLAFTQAMHDSEPIELPEDADLAGFTVADYEQFWSAILRWSIASLVLYTQAPDPRVVYPTQIVNRSEFESHMSSLTKLPIDILQCIITRLSFASTIKSPDCFLQPLIVSDESIAWSPRLVLACRHRRNMLKLMAKTSELKASADNLIGAGESVLLHEFRHCLVKRGYQLKFNTPIGSAQGKGEIDMLAWTNRAPKQVLVIEAKALLPTDEIGEVADLTKKVLGGQEQLRRAIRILGDLSVESKSRCFKFVPWAKITQVVGFVITSEGYPTSEYDHTEIPATDLPRFKMLRPRDLKTPDRIVATLRERPWFQDLSGLTEREYESIHVGDVEYQISHLVDDT